MKKILSIAAAIIFSLQLQAQNNYWVMLTDKAGTTFDPYSYFDSKAIERYRLNNADLYDITSANSMPSSPTISVRAAGSTPWPSPPRPTR